MLDNYHLVYKTFTMFCFEVVSLFLLVGSALSWTAPNYDLANAEQHFEDFIKKYNRRYDSQEEYKKRLEIFTRKLKKINEWNEKYSTENGGFTVSQFSDLEETRSCVDISRMNNTKAIKVRRESIVNAPAKLNYKEQGLVTPVKDQGTCGSCFAFAAVGSIEGVYAKKSGQLISLSNQQAFDCSHKDCHTGGDPYEAMNVLAAQGGSMSEEDYPYTGTQGTCSTDPNKIKVKVTGGTRIDTPDVETLKGALYENGSPLATLFYAPPSMQHTFGKTVINPTDCTGQAADHAITLVGYDTDSSGTQYWIIKNSWGTGRGDNGYFYLDVNSNCNFGKFTSTATVA